MDRIIKLQKINVKRAEKLDFLDEHCCTLMAELQKKTKIIQNYILHEDFDAMGSNARDKHKVTNSFLISKFFIGKINFILMLLFCRHFHASISRASEMQ